MPASWRPCGPQRRRSRLAARTSGSSSPNGVLDLAWPLTGRSAELDYVTAFLRKGQGAIVLAGPAGVRKTRLGVECLAVAAAQGFVPVRVAATRGARGL